MQLWFSWLSPDVIWLHFGSDVVQPCAWRDCVWLSFGSVVGGLSLDVAVGSVDTSYEKFPPIARLSTIKND